MTLILGGTSPDGVWMVGDTAITQGKITERQREFGLKIERSRNGRFIIGFAGGAEYGAEVSWEAAQEDEAKVAIELLRKRTDGAGTSFLLGHIDEGYPRLFLIENGRAGVRERAYIGSKEAYILFERIKRKENQPYAPDAFKQIMIGSSREIPEDLSNSITSMIDLFAMRSAHDVGGWATPYFLDSSGASFIGYAYAVSDPLFKKWTPGSVIPHGTAELGGATLSVTELHDRSGLLVYWLQNQKGYVVRRKDFEQEYESMEFEGDPTSVKAAAEASLGQPVDLWVSDQPAGPITRLLVKRGVDGRLDSTIAFHGNAMSFAVHNMSSPFTHSDEINLKPASETDKIKDLDINRISEGELEIGFGAYRHKFTTSEIDVLMRALATERANMRPEVSTQMRNLTCLAQVFPAWRSDPSLHPGLPGASLSFRHNGYGWQTFVLHPTEAKKLGLWLVGAF